jgi:hypothetical protein
LGLLSLKKIASAVKWGLVDLKGDEIYLVAQGDKNKPKRPLPPPPSQKNWRKMQNKLSSKFDLKILSGEK